MWEIVLYYIIWIAITLYHAYVLFFCGYHTRGCGRYESGDKMMFPLWAIVLAGVFAFIPFVNVCASIGLSIMLAVYADEEGLEYRTFLFRKF